MNHNKPQDEAPKLGGFESASELNYSKLESRKLQLRIFESASELIHESGVTEKFGEGPQSEASKARHRMLKNALEAGFLDNLIRECSDTGIQGIDIPEDQSNLIGNIVEAITSERGRAIVGLTVLQMCIKAICPDQSVRLHKGSGSASFFSWVDGVSMRSLDSSYVTPQLRNHGLLSVNKFGVMMTRGLAENYPYTKLYKAGLKADKGSWLEIVEQLESGCMNPDSALRYIIALLLNRSENFRKQVNLHLEIVAAYLDSSPDEGQIQLILRKHFDESSYSARLFEIALHSLFQVLAEHKCLDGCLKPLSQMRSANKKHGNIGDIEVVAALGSLQILEAWDAKYGKPYLRDEIEELSEKLQLHVEAEVVGFVVDNVPDMRPDIENRIAELQEYLQVEIRIVGFDEWVQGQFARADLSPGQIAREWLKAYSETLCQKRRVQAPIDEPTSAWIDELSRLIASEM